MKKLAVFVLILVAGVFFTGCSLFQTDKDPIDGSEDKVIFVDDFDTGALDTTLWKIKQDNDEIQVANGQLHLTASDSPWLTFEIATKDEFVPTTPWKATFTLSAPVVAVAPGPSFFAMISGDSDTLSGYWWNNGPALVVAFWPAMEGDAITSVTCRINAKGANSSDSGGAEVGVAELDGWPEKMTMELSDTEISVKFHGVDVTYPEAMSYKQQSSGIIGEHGFDFSTWSGGPYIHIGAGNSETGRGTVVLDKMEILSISK